MTAFKYAKSVMDIKVFIQESYVSGGEMFQIFFDIRWEILGKRREQRTVIGMSVNIGEIVIVETWPDVIDHPYIIILDICEFDGKGGKKKRRTKIINNFNNNMRVDNLWY